MSKTVIEIQITENAADDLTGGDVVVHNKTDMPSEVWELVKQAVAAHNNWQEKVPNADFDPNYLESESNPKSIDNYNQAWNVTVAFRQSVEKILQGYNRVQAEKQAREMVDNLVSQQKSTLRVTDMQAGE